MKTLLTAPDIEYLMTQQEKLDQDIREKKGITKDQWMSDEFDVKHTIALKVEVAEFINESHGWKYWKSKPISRERIIDEAVDVIHFCVLGLNKAGMNPSRYHIMLTIRAENPLPLSIEEFQLEMLSTNNELDIMSYLLKILDKYNFTTQDILDAYNRKNKVNFERLESGY